MSGRERPPDIFPSKDQAKLSLVNFEITIFLFTLDLSTYRIIQLETGRL